MGKKKKYTMRIKKGLIVELSKKQLQDLKFLVENKLADIELLHPDACSYKHDCECSTCEPKYHG